jgi:hypothetical protein
LRQGIAAIVLVAACTRAEPRIEPAPEKSEVPAPVVVPKPPVVISAVRCTYGGTAPAFFVRFVLEAHGKLVRLRAKSFQVAADGGFVDAVESRIGYGILDLRSNGEAGLGVVPAEVRPTDRLELEIFGPLRTDVFGKGETYPTEDRAFRAEIEADGQGPFVVEGRCAVGPAG